MIDFSTLQGLTIPEGVVTQITDASGRVLWVLQSGGKVILEVEKITSDTYAAETTYTGEQFILLDIYPKTNGTVKVTYGGLTKTITDTSGAEEPNAQQVFFGTFNGVSDEVETPASGELTIKGDYYAYGCGKYNTMKLVTARFDRIVQVREFGVVEKIPDYAFCNCEKINITEIPEGVISIGMSAFEMPFTVTNETYGAMEGYFNTPMDGGIMILPTTIQSIGDRAFCTFFEIDPTTYSRSYLSEVKILATTPPTFTGGNAGWSRGPFNGVAKITVPKGCGEAYKAASDWSYYADYITEES